MSIRKPRWLLAAAPAVVLAVTLTACGSDSEEETADDNGGSSESGAQEQEDDAAEGDEGADGAEADGADEGSPENQDQEAGGGQPMENGDAVELELGEASGPVPYGESWEFDATVERAEPGAWEDLEGSPVYDEGYQGLDPYFVEMTLTNESDTAYEGGYPSNDLRVQADDGGPFETVEAMDAANLPEWCEYSSPSASTAIEPGETVTECQVILVGHGVGAVSVDWWAGYAVSWALN
jgi:hypothetical protein